MNTSHSTKRIICKDHLGNTYPSLTAMLSAYNIPDISYRYRKYKGWSLERILTTPVMDYRNAGSMECQDHLGNKFKSKKDMCDYWRIPRTTYFRRIKSGWSLEKSLTTPAKCTFQKNMVYDHKENEFETVDDMCAYWNITKAQYIINMRNNLPLERALKEHTKLPEKPKDHLGNEYKSVNEMCRAYGINKTKLRSRLELGWTLKEILENPENKTNNKQIKDINGNTFETTKEAIAAAGISYASYQHRIQKMGMTPEEAISVKKLHLKECKDFTGKKFKCQMDMLQYWLSGTGAYHHHLKRGMSEHEALRFLFPSNKNWRTMNIKQKLSDHYYLLHYNNTDQIMHDTEIFKILRRKRIYEQLDISKELSNGWTWHASSGKWHHIVHDDGRSLIISDDELYEMLFFIFPKFNPDNYF